MTDTSNDYCGAECSCVAPEDCVYSISVPNEPTPDNRNADGLNKFGCAYTDCGCTEPCTQTATSGEVSYKGSLPGAASNIVINGDFYGDIVING